MLDLEAQAELIGKIRLAVIEANKLLLVSRRSLAEAQHAVDVSRRTRDRSLSLVRLLPEYP
jgi:hypothetical protein